MGFKPRFYIGKSFAAVEVRLPGSKEVEVGTIYEEDGLSHRENDEGRLNQALLED